MERIKIEAAIKKIKSMAGDDEAQRFLEDELREKFIKDIARYPGTMGDKAKLVLSTKKIKFSRWCA